MKSPMTLSKASLVVAALLATAACMPTAETAQPSDAIATVASADVTPFKVGTLEVIALRDGGLSGLPNDNTILGVGRTPAEVAAVLTANGLPGDSFDLSIQPLLVRDGTRLVLIDAGAGASMGPGAGRLPASLRAAGVEPSAVTDVLISHSHGDHVAGLVDASGTLTFANATIRMSAPEWAYLQGQAEMKALVDAIRPKVQTFEYGSAVSPSITAVAIQGHTPGSVGYQIASGSDRLFYIGDTMHHSVISVQRPQWRIAFDGDVPAATASREAILERAASENLKLYAVHFPYPGVGRIQRRGEGFVWVPAQ